MQTERSGTPVDWTGWGGACVLLVLMVGLAVVQASRRPLWHDEIYTVAAATQPRMADLFRMAASGADMMPPLNAVATFVVVGVVGSGEISARVPAMLGFATMLLIIFVAVRERADVVAGWSAMLIACFTVAFAYAYEARGYGLLLGATSLCWYAWLRAAANARRRGWLVTLGLATAAAVWTHYYAVLALVPILAGEVVRWRQRGRPDAGVAIAVMAGLGSALPLLPMLSAAVGAAGTYWQRARWGDLFDVYRFLAGFLLGRRFLLLALVVGGLLAFGWVTGRRPLARRALPLHERIAVLAVVLMPVLAMATALMSTGVMVPRYVLPTVMACAVIPPWLVWRWSPGRGVPFVLLAGLVLAFTQSAVVAARNRDRDPVPLMAAVQGSAVAGQAQLPIVVTGTAFLQVWYYASPDLRGRIRYVADPEASVRLAGSDTVDRGYLALRFWVPITVEAYGPFIAAHEAFIVCASEPGWLLPRLREDGAHVSAVADPDGPCWRVTTRS